MTLTMVKYYWWLVTSTTLSTKPHKLLSFNAVWVTWMQGTWYHCTAISMPCISGILHTKLQCHVVLMWLAPMHLHIHNMYLNLPLLSARSFFFLLSKFQLMDTCCHTDLSIFCYSYCAHMAQSPVPVVQICLIRCQRSILVLCQDSASHQPLLLGSSGALGWHDNL